MLWRFRAGTGLSIGMAWEEDALRVVELQPSGAGYQVKAFSFALPDGSFADGTINDKKLLVELLENIRKENRWGRRTVVTALPPNQVLIKYMKLPSLSVDKLKEEVYREAEQFFDTRLADYSFDYMVLDREAPKQGRQEATVMLAAIPREKAFYLYELFSEAGFNLKAIDIVPLALMRALIGYREKEQGRGATVLLDLGKRYAQLAITAHGQLSFARSLPFCLAEDSEDRTNVNNQNVLSRAKELLTEMRRSLDYYQAKSRQKAAELIVSGTSCKRPDLLALLQELELRVVQGVPGHGLILNQHPDSSFTVAVGLALKGVRS